MSSRSSFLEFCLILVAIFHVNGYLISNILRIESCLLRNEMTQPNVRAATNIRGIIRTARSTGLKQSASDHGSNTKAWKSKPAFTKNNSVHKDGGNTGKAGSSDRRGMRRGNDPWWMREDEETNPRMLPAYKPWWAGDVTLMTEKLKLPELKEEASRRNIDMTGKRSELIERINAVALIYDLSDRNMKKPTFTDNSSVAFPKCYPQSYDP